MPFLLAEILNFQGSAHHVGVGSLSKEYKQGEERQPMLDHRGRPIPIDTWVWIMPKE